MKDHANKTYLTERELSTFQQYLIVVGAAFVSFAIIFIGVK